MLAFLDTLASRSPGILPAIGAGYVTATIAMLALCAA